MSVEAEEWTKCNTCGLRHRARGGGCPRCASGGGQAPIAAAGGYSPFVEDAAPEERSGTDSGIILGFAMMAGASVWFILGFFGLGRIFFYPPVLFVIGFVSLVKGIINRRA